MGLYKLGCAVAIVAGAAVLYSLGDGYSKAQDTPTTTSRQNNTPSTLENTACEEAKDTVEGVEISGGRIYNLKRDKSGRISVTEFK